MPNAFHFISELPHTDTADRLQPPFRPARLLSATLLSRTLFFKGFSGLVIHVLKTLSSSLCKSAAPISCRSTILARQSIRTRAASAGIRI